MNLVIIKFMNELDQDENYDDYDTEFEEVEIIEKTPYKFDPATQKRLLDAIRLGSFIEHACSYAGINSSTFRRWRIDAENGVEPFASFWSEITLAESEAVVRRMARIEEAGNNGQWQADAWFLERKYPQKFGRRDKVELTADPNAPIEVELKWPDGQVISPPKEEILIDPDQVVEAKGEEE
jgi:hypothetical protein